MHPRANVATVTEPRTTTKKQFGAGRLTQTREPRTAASATGK